MSTIEIFYWFVKIVLLIITLFVGEVSNLLCLIKPAPEPLTLEELHGTGTIAFIPTEKFPIHQLESYARFFRDTYHLPIRIYPTLRLPPSAFDSDRGQYVAEEVLAEVERRYFPLVTPAIRLVPIVFTDQDIYIREYNWRYAFSLRKKGMAVVSSFRMGYSPFPFEQADQATRNTRLRKMVTKNIGILYYHLPPSDFCQNAMYGHVGGPQELDLMSDHL